MPSIARSAPSVEPVHLALRAFLGISRECVLPRAEDALSRNSHPDVVVSLSPSGQLSKQLRHAGYSHELRFAVLPSRARVRWMLPQMGNVASTVGLEMYTPFSVAGRVMKMLLKIQSAGRKGWGCPGVLIASRKQTALEILACQVTGHKEILFSLLLGTPTAFQKLTVQVMARDGRILAYAKLPLTQAAEKRIKHEAGILETLSNDPKLRSRVPRLLYSGMLNENYILMQSPLPGVAGPTRFSGMHQEFLSLLHAVQPSIQSGSELVGDVGRRWDEVAVDATSRLRDLAKEALREAARDRQTAQVLCAIHHGDFAPWNTRIHQGTLFSFDWESACSRAPVLWDQFHFQAQTESLLHTKPAPPMDLRRHNRALYLLYLLHSAAQLIEEKAAANVIAYRERQLARHIHESAIRAV